MNGSSIPARANLLNVVGIKNDLSQNLKLFVDRCTNPELCSPTLRSFIVSIQCFVPNALGRPPHPEFPKWFLERYRFDCLQNMVEPSEHTARILRRVNINSLEFRPWVFNNLNTSGVC